MSAVYRFLIEKHELEGNGKEEIATYCQVISRHFCERSKLSHNKPQVIWCLCRYFSLTLLPTPGRAWGSVAVKALRY